MRYRWFLVPGLLLFAWQLHCRMPAPHPDGPSTASPASPSTVRGPSLTPSTPGSDRLRIGTWNVRRLGHGEQRFDLLAQIIRTGFDVVALQEVMSPEGVDRLLDELPGWTAELSPEPVGSERYKEWYAILYRTSMVTVLRSFVMDDASNAIARDPFIACLRCAEFDFCLVSAHIVFGDRVAERDEEIHILGDEVAALRKRDREKDWIVLGDFNRAPGAPGFRALRAQGWRFTLPGRVATSLGKAGYSSEYDHVLVDDRHTGELMGDARRIDIVNRVCHGSFATCRDQVSDHAPVVASFQVTRPDDD